MCSVIKMSTCKMLGLSVWCTIHIWCEHTLSAIHMLTICLRFFDFRMLDRFEHTFYIIIHSSHHIERRITALYACNDVWTHFHCCCCCFWIFKSLIGLSSRLRTHVKLVANNLCIHSLTEHRTKTYYSCFCSLW